MLTESLGKLPPQALDLEVAILGALMLERNQLTAGVLAMMSGNDFYDDRHKEIFLAMQELTKAGEPVDARTVTARLRKTGKLELVGNSFYLAELTSAVSSAANIETYMRTVMEMAIKRELIMFASEIQNEAYDDTSDPFALVDKVAAFPPTMLGRYASGKLVHIKDAVVALGMEINNRTEDLQLLGFPSGYERLDHITGGLQETDLILIGGRPSMGKTTLALNILRNAAADFKVPGLIISYEMSTRQLVIKLCAMETDIDARKIQSKAFNDLETRRFGDYTLKLCNAPLWIDDQLPGSLDEFVQMVTKHVRQHGIKIIMIDYLQLMKAGRNFKGNREQEISEISRTLKTRICKKLNVCVIALVQLSREVEKRGGDKRPMLADMRESGSLEQDADIVIFPYRPAYYKITGDGDGTFIDGLTILGIAKNRNGVAGIDTYIRMQASQSKFETISSAYLDKGDNTSFVPKSVQYNPDQHINPTANENPDDLPF